MKIDIAALVKSPECLQSLANVSVDLEELSSRMERYAELLHEWNAFASLMSQGDAAGGIPAHIVDALSLAPLVGRLTTAESHLVDIGSGGGFPAIPVKAALPGLHVTLVERSQRKAGFLIKAIGALGLKGIEVIRAAYPSSERALEGNLFTARAVERPGRSHSGGAGASGTGERAVEPDRVSCGDQGWSVPRGTYSGCVDASGTSAWEPGTDPPKHLTFHVERHSTSSSIAASNRSAMSSVSSPGPNVSTTAGESCQ